jgi:AraC family transcriptional regulator of adaptative response / DNA-3-methyladenine glycosylase II
MKDLYQALLSRDHRFDGRFIVAVKTTGVYCRPICPARPKPENVEFFRDAVSAEQAGYRPCLRCRPECAPRSPAWLGKRAVVQRALKLIARNEFHRSNAQEFAARLGVSARHLRRLFEEQIGQTPKQISDNNRLNFARKLVVETDNPLMTIALSAGFRSLRRFNAAFQKRFRRPPSQLRRAHMRRDASDGIDVKLSYITPYDWRSIFDFYKTHPIPGLETATERSFERVFRNGDTIGFFRVQARPGVPQLDLRIIAEDPNVLFDVVSRVRAMFDLDLDPMLIARQFAGVPPLARLHERFPGLRLAGGWDGFETAVCCILGQLVSAAQRSRLVSQLVGAYGEEVFHPVTGEKARLFPTPKRLAESDLGALATSAARKAAIRDLSRRVLSGAVRFSQAQDPVAFRKALLETKGLGVWSVENICLRAFGDTDAFPKTDLILERALRFQPSLDLENIRPWRAYAAIYLWQAFAHRPQRNGEGNHAVLQGDGIARRQTEIGRQRRRTGGCAVGMGKSRWHWSRRAKDQCSPDSSGDRATTGRVFRREKNPI